jgi:hypothetical protein
LEISFLERMGRGQEVRIKKGEDEVKFAVIKISNLRGVIKNQEGFEFKGKGVKEESGIGF